MELQIKTEKGLLEGVDCGDHIEFRGVPYAAPPVGNLRWRAPLEAEAWEGVRRADRFADIAIQELPEADNPFTGKYYREFYHDPEFKFPMSEDCLYLNIWVPKCNDTEKLPVALWIHGGGFSSGFAGEMEFDGAAYCRKGVILVTAAYRLNVFGFLAHPWLTQESERNVSGNYGTLDQIAALQWVYRNISAFGGDPENITVMGQSAGSKSTQVLVSSGLTGNIIKRAVMQSGVSCRKEIFIEPDLAEAEELGCRFVSLTGAENLMQLRAMSAESLIRVFKEFSAQMFREGKGLVFVPNADGYVLPKRASEIWRDGDMKKIPYLTGTVRGDLSDTQKQTEEGIPGILMEECADWCLKCEELGLDGYIYYFSHELPGPEWNYFHSSELWYMFGTYGRCWRPMTEEDAALSDRMVTYWTNFIKYGTPCPESASDWRPYTKNDRFIKRLE